MIGLTEQWVTAEMVSAFICSRQYKNQQAEAERELQLPNYVLRTMSHKVWGSRQIMTERVLKQERVISHVLSMTEMSYTSSLLGEYVLEVTKRFSALLSLMICIPVSVSFVELDVTCTIKTKF